MHKLAFMGAAAAVVLVVAVVGYNLFPALGIVGPGAPPAPSPSLLARGDFIEHDWHRVVFEATRVGSAVTGQMMVGVGRSTDAQASQGDAIEPWPLIVELQCARTSEDGLVLIGGVTTNEPSDLSSLQAGSWAGIVLERGPSEIVIKHGRSIRATVWIGPATDVAPHATDCLSFLDAQLMDARIRDIPGRAWRPSPANNAEAIVEFGR